MRKIVSSQKINNFDIIYECPGVKGFISRFGADKIYFASPDYHFP